MFLSKQSFRCYFSIVSIFNLKKGSLQRNVKLSTISQALLFIFLSRNALEPKTLKANDRASIPSTANLHYLD